LKKKIAIIIKADDKTHKYEREQGAIIGLEKLKTDWFKTEGAETYTIRYITAEQWENLSEMAKLKLLTALTN
jgi:hypothetical protein